MQAENFAPVIGLVAVIGFYGIPILGVVCHFAHKSMNAWMATSLKRDMVARGYTAQEIIEVIAAESGSNKKQCLRDIPPAKPIKQPQYSS